MTTADAGSIKEGGNRYEDAPKRGEINATAPIIQFAGKRIR